ncbi:MAG: multicopper oxidase domain-containing protein [Acidimicrobiales bacterium]
MEQLTDTPSARKRDDLFAIAVGVAVLAMVFAVVGVGFGLRAIDESESNVSAGGAAAATSAPVSLTEFAITDATVGVGGALEVSNDGAVAHDLSIEGADLVTPQLAGGATEALSLAGLEPGSYTMFCSIPGHRDSGMEATLEVVEGGGTETAGEPAAGGHGDMDYEAMTASMLDSMNQFPAETEGVGNLPLEPTEVKADGTKVFDLTAAITKWEREPGDIVDAWTYNGMVPGPMIRLAIGEKAEIRLQNDLPIATDLHLHGLNVDLASDGVAPYTQDPIEPGGTYTYEYTADEQAVAMFHPHFHSQIGMPNGMFGTILVGDVRLPRGQTVGLEEVPADLVVDQELPMVLNDSGVIGLSLNGKSFPATAPLVAAKDEWVLIHYYNEGNAVHPMHMHQFDQIVVAKDGYPLDAPYTADVVNVAPGERYSVLVHMDKPGTWVWHCHILPHVENDERMLGMVTAVVVE